MVIKQEVEIIVVEYGTPLFECDVTLSIVHVAAAETNPPSMHEPMCNVQSVTDARTTTQTGTEDKYT